MGYSQQVKEDAAKAAAYIREHGWCQRISFGLNGSCCAYGAATAVVPDDDYDRYDDLCNAAREVAGTEYLSLWNDAEGRTAEDVIGLFDRIANS